MGRKRRTGERERQQESRVILENDTVKGWRTQMCSFILRRHSGF